MNPEKYYGKKVKAVWSDGYEDIGIFIGYTPPADDPYGRESFDLKDDKGQYNLVYVDEMQSIEIIS